MTKVEYYRISPSVDITITGVGDNGQIYEFVDPENNNRERTSKYQAPITTDYLSRHGYDLDKFKLQGNANLTNMLSSNYLKTSGIFISKKLKDIIDSFRLYKCEIIPVKLNYKEEEISYYYLNAIDSYDLVDFKKSVFVFDKRIEKMRDGGIPVSVSTFEEYLDMHIKTPEEYAGKTILPKKVILKEYYDLLYAPFSASVFITKELKDAILSNGINDIEIKEVKYEEYFVA